MMNLDLQERLEFLADELAREEAIVLVQVSAHLAMELEDWSKPVQIRMVEEPETPGLFEMIVRNVDAPKGPDS